MTTLAYDKLKARRDEIFKSGTYTESSFQLVSYDLRVDDTEALIDGRYYATGASSKTGLVEIPGGQIAFLSTIEELTMPINLIGKIGLRFEYTRKGLIALFGPQVDPLYIGRLYLPVYNPGEKSIYLKPGDKLFNIEFHTILTDKYLIAADFRLGL